MLPPKIPDLLLEARAYNTVGTVDHMDRDSPFARFSDMLVWLGAKQESDEIEQ